MCNPVYFVLLQLYPFLKNPHRLLLRASLKVRVSRVAGVATDYRKWAKSQISISSTNFVNVEEQQTDYRVERWTSSNDISYVCFESCMSFANVIFKLLIQKLRILKSTWLCYFSGSGELNDDPRWSQCLSAAVGHFRRPPQGSEVRLRPLRRRPHVLRHRTTELARELPGHVVPAGVKLQTCVNYDLLNQKRKSQKINEVNKSGWTSNITELPIT